MSLLGWLELCISSYKMPFSSSAQALWARAVTWAANMIHHFFMRVYMSDWMSRRGIVLNVVVLLLLLRECGAQTVHMCLDFHASVLCFSTHAVWLLIRSCLISIEKPRSPPQLVLLWAINYANKNHLKICAVYFMNICGYRNVPQTKHRAFVMFQAAWMLFVCGWIVFFFHSYCS